MQPAFPGYKSCHSSYSLSTARPCTISSWVSVRLRCEGKQFPQYWSVVVFCGMNLDILVCEESWFYRMVEVLICGSRSDSCCSRNLPNVNWQGLVSSGMAFPEHPRANLLTIRSLLRRCDRISGYELSWSILKPLKVCSSCDGIKSAWYRTALIDLSFPFAHP